VVITDVVITDVVITDVVITDVVITDVVEEDGAGEMIMTPTPSVGQSQTHDGMK
jgi:hypothetical protein